MFAEFSGNLTQLKRTYNRISDRKLILEKYTQLMPKMDQAMKTVQYIVDAIYEYRVYGVSGHGY